MSFLSEKRHKYSNFYNTNKEYYLWFEDFPTPAFLRFSSVDMYISTYFIHILLFIHFKRRGYTVCRPILIGSVSHCKFQFAAIHQFFMFEPGLVPIFAI